MKFKIFLFGVLTLCFLPLLTLSGYAHEGKPLIVVGDANFPPVEYIENGKVKGFNAEIWQELSKAMNRPVEMRLMPWKDSQQKVLNGEADALTLLGRTKQREKLYDFSEPTLTFEFCFFIRTNDVPVEAIKDFEGRTIGVTKGGFAREVLESHKDIKLLFIKNNLEGFHLLTSGKIDAVGTDKWVGAYTIQKNQITGVNIVEKPFAKSIAAIPVKKGNLKLLNEINNGIKKLRKDKAIQTILDKWSPKEVVFLTKGKIWRIIIVGITAFLIAVIVFSLLWIVLLKRQVNRQTEQLRQEIGERKRAAETLRKSEERFSGMFEHMSSGVAVYESVDNGEDFVFKAFNPAAEGITHISQNDALGNRLLDIFPHMDKSGFLGALQRVWKTGREEHIPPFYYKDEIREGWRENRIYMLPTGEIVALFDDVTERKQAEEALRESEEKYRNLFENAPIGISIVDKARNILDFNNAMLKLHGYRREDRAAIGLTSEYYDNPEDREKVTAQLAKNGFVNEMEVRFKRKDGTSYDALLSMRPIEIGGKSLWHAMIQDISERKQAEEALRESEERYRTVADFTYDWEYWLAPDGQYIYVSPSCERITGYSPDEFITDPGLLEKIVHPDDHSMVVSHIRGEQKPEELFPIDFRIITRSGEERWIKHNCQPVHDIDATYLGRRGGNRDISKRKQMEEELLKAKKLESLGVLAGGIAHDFNNLMSAVVGNISLARIEMKPESKGFKNLVEAEKASIRTKALTARLITFSEGGGPVKETVSIDDLVKDSVDSSLKGSDIDVGFSIPDDISPVEADEEQMKQVILNIITNAQEAMAGQGTINVSCENADIGVKDTLTLRKGKYVKISIKDQGPGIPDEDLAKIFDPYFSTKEMGTQKGMGLGLAVSDSIIKQHDGLITVKSELGTGTIISIYLPASEKEIKEAVPVKKPVPEQPLSQGKKILVMDDEEVVRDVTNALLTHIGYKAEVAVDGVEAIEMYRKAMESGKPYDLVILDLTNNFGMGGVETIKRLLEIDPDVRAIVSTGYSTDPIISNFREHGFRGALPKPYTLDQLKTTLHNAIAAE